MMAAEKSKRVGHPTLRSTNRLEKSVRPCRQKPNTESNERTRSRHTAPGMDLKTVATTQIRNEAWTLQVKKSQNNKGVQQRAPESSMVFTLLVDTVPAALNKNGGIKGEDYGFTLDEIEEEEKRDLTIAYTVKESSADMDEGEAAGSFQEALLAWRGDARPKMGEMESTSLLDGHIDETETAVIFQKNLLAWCGGGNAAAAATASCGIAWCNISWTWSLVARLSMKRVSSMTMAKHTCKRTSSPTSRMNKMLRSTTRCLELELELNTLHPRCKWINGCKGCWNHRTTTTRMWREVWRRRTWRILLIRR